MLLKVVSPHLLDRWPFVGESLDAVHRQRCILTTVILPFRGMVQFRSYRVAVGVDHVIEWFRVASRPP